MSGIKTIEPVRKDRDGNLIQKGGKKHKIKFRDELMFKVVKAKPIQQITSKVKIEDTFRQNMERLVNQ